MQPLPHPLIAEALTEWARVECDRLPDAAVRPIAGAVVSSIGEFVKWADRAELLIEGCDRTQNYHKFPPQIIHRARAQRVPLDARSNGPAIVAFLLAGGRRPTRFGHTYGWPIHHQYHETQFRERPRDGSTHSRLPRRSAKREFAGDAPVPVVAGLAGPAFQRSPTEAASHRFRRCSSAGPHRDHVFNDHGQALGGVKKQRQVPVCSIRPVLPPYSFSAM